MKTKGAMISLGVKATMIKTPRDLIKSQGNHLLTPMWGLHLLKHQDKTSIPLGIFTRDGAWSAKQRRKDPIGRNHARGLRTLRLKACPRKLNESESIHR